MACTMCQIRSLTRTILESSCKSVTSAQKFIGGEEDWSFLNKIVCQSIKQNIPDANGLTVKTGRVREDSDLICRVSFSYKNEPVSVSIKVK